MPEMTEENAGLLRKPFPSKAIGKLPKPYKADSQRGNCNECGGYHGLPAVHLDYVGHAATTDRLLAVDPSWTWEPLALDEQGLPALDRKGNLWIKLTVCGVTRVGVGDGKSAKECIGDAIRNAAMRFGVALDLWAKEDLHDVRQQQSPPAASPPEDPWQPAIDEANRTDGTTLLDTKSKLAKAMYAAINAAGIPEEERIEQVGLIIGRQIASTKEMTPAEARKVLDHLPTAAPAPPAPPEPEAEA